MQKRNLFLAIGAAAFAVASVAFVPAGLSAAVLLCLLVVAILLAPFQISRAQIAVLAIFAILGAGALLFGYSWVDVGAGAFALANAPGGLEMKQIQEAIDKATKTVKETTDRMQQALDQAINDVKVRETVQAKSLDELKTASAESIKSQTALKAAVDKAMAEAQEMRQELDGIKRGRGGPLAPEGKSWGQIVTESEAWKNAKGKDGKGKPEMEQVEVGSWHKTRILSGDVQTAAGTVPYMAQAERVGFVAGTERQLVVRNLIPVYQTESPLIEFCRENVFTNNAQPQGVNSSPAETEGQIKGESGITFTFVQQPVITIAHWIPASRQVLSDAKMLGSYIDQRLRYGVLLEEEDEVLNSTGTGGELNGLVNQATAYNRRATADNRLDTLLKAFLQVTLSDYAADGAVMSHVDWTELLLLKDTQGRYLFGDPSSMKTPAVWGRPVVPSNSMTVGNFLVGAFQLAAALWDREQATVRIAEQHSDFFVRNMVVLLAEERVALVVYRPTAIVSGSFGVAAGQPG
jgi:HK97 family phage major capsid protein